MAEKVTVLEMLHEKHQKPIVALELPDDDLITEVEEMIYVQIRGDFRDFLLEASDLVIGTLEPVTVTEPGSHTYLPDVASDAWAEGLSRELLPFCKTPTGYYCLDLEDEVILWENGKILGGWNSIWSWAEEVWCNS
ncbi:MAG: SMI1/KNR4 family protein [Marinagarivorans sp.]|nr:SMI1/KNR4 family protein [Marinagarivorans sp.]